MTKSTNSKQSLSVIPDHPEKSAPLVEPINRGFAVASFGITRTTMLAQDDKGPFVLYGDYAKLKCERDELRAELTNERAKVAKLRDVMARVATCYCSESFECQSCKAIKAITATAPNAPNEK